MCTCRLILALFEMSVFSNKLLLLEEGPRTFPSVFYTRGSLWMPSYVVLQYHTSTMYINCMQFSTWYGFV